MAQRLALKNYHFSKFMKRRNKIMKDMMTKFNKMSVMKLEILKDNCKIKKEKKETRKKKNQRKLINKGLEKVMVYRG
jgi:hypothetical protein